MYLIPAIDIMDGHCVRLTQGSYDNRKTYHEDPLTVALAFQTAGLQRLHLVDLDGAKSGKVKNWQVVESLCDQTSLTIDFGGGIQQDGDIGRLFELGVHQVNIGSKAVKDPVTVMRWMDQFGPERIILSADARNGRIAVDGWQSDGGLDLFQFIQQYHNAGTRFVTCTDIERDGMMGGSNTALYALLIERFPDIHLIASGGVNSIADLEKLSSAGLYGAIVGKAIYEGHLTPDDLAQFQTRHTC
ncbi:MAG: 1-(5-phosphoribosyl)-5-[(5-phosphoribosylamino)methylideneamino]imidazole-4-carboxamide isomerase [Cyclobacteriaceae bacterium]|nr:1-(5-phosphoribosyl)-5-[(5-phosphoribosylamino)methylideneamino]imidazole-4-carboxamide isomerase [Cyclobacteriaceae bacterium]